MSLGSEVAEVTVTDNSPLCAATSSLKPSITLLVSPSLPFSDKTVNRFLVISESDSFLGPLSSLANMELRPLLRSLRDKVGL